ncbi:MAG: formylglycine-generating enzyme family protein [Leptolyngbya sp. SIO4C1]|nr:formylglycine-generating enzyme family protein [Leptolyngbya sp. SIO4C1]
MEASEQQRRPTIGQSAQKLRQQLGLDFDAVDLADMFWLAQFIELDRSARSDGISEPHPGAEPKPLKTVDEGTATASDTPTANLYIDDRRDEPSQPSSVTEEEEEEPPPGTPFPVPAAPALRTRLDLARSLRPLMRKVPSRIRQELDEEATVTQIAETRLWVPVVQAQPERWLDLELVVEDSKTTVVWERAIAELQHLVEYQGAFRTIRTWRLSVPDLKTASPRDLMLFPRWREPPEACQYQRPHSPRELLDPSSRRMILLLTDCTSALWWRGLIHETLWAWAEAQPVSIVQLFPERLWTRTALSNGHIVRLGTTGSGLPSSRLEVEGLPNLEVWDQWDEADETPANGQTPNGEQRLLTVPVVTLEPHAMHRWARVIAGSGGTLTPGRVFELKSVRQIAQEYQAKSTAPVRSRTARQRVALFRSAASEMAQQLAEYMAATPVSLPVIDLLRDEFVPEARQEHVAEVLLSGLLQRCDEEEEGQCRYQFFGDDDPGDQSQRVRYLLLDSVPISRPLEVLDRLSQLIRDRAGNTLKSFEAFLAAYEATGDALGEGALPLAAVGLDVLQRLGGPHAALAQRYATVVQPAERRRQPQQTTEDNFPLHTVDYEVAEFLNFPPLQPFDFKSPTIITLLKHAFEFETATLERDRESEEWVIRRRQAEAWGYIESLGEDTDTDDNLNLEMVAIPGGTFMMGAPEEESGSTDDERPQHEVTLQPFYMSRYPVTQAQWRAIATAASQKAIQTFEEALQAADLAVRSIRAEGLRDIERIVLEGSWNQQTYQSMASEVPYQASSLKDAGTKLWSVLSDALGIPVKKRNFRTAIEHGANQSDLGSKRNLDPDPSNFEGNHLPVEQVSWEDAQEFCRRLSAKTGKDYRLPTEAEWEYACRAGTTTPFHFGETIAADLANYGAQSAFGEGPIGEYRGKTTVVGRFPANAFGLYDMHGNVWEWCEDYWHDTYEGAPEDGSAWISSDKSKKSRVLRGGSWDDDPGFCRSAFRFGDAPDFRFNDTGFRVVCGLARD